MLAHLGAMLAHLGAMLAQLGRFLGPNLGYVGPSWATRSKKWETQKTLENAVWNMVGGTGRRPQFSFGEGDAYGKATENKQDGTRFVHKLTWNQEAGVWGRWKRMCGDHMRLAWHLSVDDRKLTVWAKVRNMSTLDEPGCGMIRHWYQLISLFWTKLSYCLKWMEETFLLMASESNGLGMPADVPASPKASPKAFVLRKRRISAVAASTEPSPLHIFALQYAEDGSTAHVECEAGMPCYVLLLNQQGNASTSPSFFFNLKNSLAQWVEECHRADTALPATVSSLVGVWDFERRPGL